MSTGGVRQWLSGGTRGQSSPLGYLLVIAVVLAGTISIVALGTSALESTQGQSELQRAEHSMTLFDSRTAMVALGASNTQTVSFGQDSGSFQSKQDAGWIKIEHRDYTESGGNTEVIYNQSLGRVVYTNGNTEIAYQGGGVWRKDRTGDALMISPPEFHYRMATLTLPIIRVRNDGQGSGNSRVTVSQKSTTAVYPDSVDAPDGGDSSIGPPYNVTAPNGQSLEYQNPIKNGTVFVTVHSKYYEGWETYFEERTTGRVTVDEDKEIVTLELISFGGAPGAFDLPQPGDSVDANGIADGHPLNKFDVTLNVEKKNPHFSFYATESGKEFEIHVYSDVNPNNGCPDSSTDVYISVYYHGGSGAETYEAFETAPTVDSSESWIDWQCSGGEVDLAIDFLNSHSMVYDEINKGNGDVDPSIDYPNSGTANDATLGNKFAFNEHILDEGGWEMNDTATWYQHDPAVSYEDSSRTYAEGTGTETMNRVVNHYLQLIGPDVDLISKAGPGKSDAIDEPTSRGSLEYTENAGSEFIAFLHVTENDIEVDFG